MRRDHLPLLMPPLPPSALPPPPHAPLPPSALSWEGTASPKGPASLHTAGGSGLVPTSHPICPRPCSYRTEGRNSGLWDVCRGGWWFWGGQGGGCKEFQSKTPLPPVTATAALYTQAAAEAPAPWSPWKQPSLLKSHPPIEPVQATTFKACTISDRLLQLFRETEHTSQ